MPTLLHTCFLPQMCTMPEGLSVVPGVPLTVPLPPTALHTCLLMQMRTMPEGLSMVPGVPPTVPPRLLHQQSNPSSLSSLNWGVKQPSVEEERNEQGAGMMEVEEYMVHSRSVNFCCRSATENLLHTQTIEEAAEGGESEGSIRMTKRAATVQRHRSQQSLQLQQQQASAGGSPSVTATVTAAYGNEPGALAHQSTAGRTMGTMTGSLLGGRLGSSVASMGGGAAPPQHQSTEGDAHLMSRGSSVAHGAMSPLAGPSTPLQVVEVAVSAISNAATNE